MMRNKLSMLLVITLCLTMLFSIPAYADDTSLRISFARQILQKTSITYSYGSEHYNSHKDDGALAHDNIVDTANGEAAKRSNYGTAPGGSVYLSVNMLRAILDLEAEYGSLKITEIAGASHSSGSKHYDGIAFDIKYIGGELSESRGREAYNYLVGLGYSLKPASSKHPNTILEYNSNGSFTHYHVAVTGYSGSSNVLDVNGYLDGADSGNLSNYGTFDVWINGSKVSDDVNDFCSEYPAGTTYRIDDIKSSGIHTYHGVKNGSLEGTIQNQRVDVSLIFRTNDPVGDDFYAYITSRGGDLQLVSSSGASDNVGAEANSTATSHVWHFHRLNSNNEYKITSAVDGRTLDVLNYGQESGTNLQLRDYSGNTAQTWIIHEENGYVEIGAKCTPCVIDCGQSASNGKFNAYMSREWWNDYQWFKLDKISNYQPPAVAVSTNKSSYKLGETVTISWAEPTGYDVWVYGIRRNNSSTYYTSNNGTSGTTSTWKPTETGTYTLEFAYRSLEGVTSKLSTCTFTVLDEEVKISFNKQNITMKSGETTELVVSFSGNNIASLGMTSDSSSICTPTVSGANWVAYPGTCTATVNLTASSLGTTKITFSLYDSNKKVIQSLNTTVTVTGYYIDLNGSLDGTAKSNLGDFGRADIYINGSLVQRSVSDYYQQWPKGTTYEIKNITATEGYQYAGSGSINGTVGNSNVGITLPFIKTYLIDLNATLDGQKIYNITGIGRAALLINDESVTTSAITDYSERWPSGTKWQFHVVPMEGYNYYPGGSTNLSGTIGSSNVETVLMFTTKTYKITYNANGGSGAPSEQVKRHNEDLPLSSSIPVRTGYDFIGWARSSTATTAEYQPEDYFDRDVDTTLYAVWRIKTYTVTYNANGGTGAPSNQSKNHGTTLMLSSTTPTRANSSAGSYTVTLNANGGSVSQSSITAARTTSYTFKNWNTKSDGSGTAYNAGASYTANVDATLYAQWNSSTNTAEITLPTPIRGGCDFVGWSTSSNASSGVTGKYTPSGNVTLYAIWKPKTYTVKYDANGGTGAPSNQTKYHGTALTLSSVKPTRADSSAGSYTVTLNANGGKVNPGSLSAARTNNYTFKCWNIRADGSGTDYEAGANFNLNENTTLYAQWRIGSTVYSVILPTPTREGYSFQGWATSKNATSGMTGNYVPGNNVTLFAIWKELEPDFVLPSALREIGEEAFVGGAFTYVHVPENVTKIGSRAFANCSRLKTIDIPVATTAIDPSAFDGVTGLTIHGADGSYAEFFASKHGFNFIAVP